MKINYVERIKMIFLKKKIIKIFEMNKIFFEQLDKIFLAKYSQDESIFIDSEINLEHFENLQFDLLTQLITSQSNINIIKSILDIYYRILRLDKEYMVTPREFLSAWVISRFPKYILQSGINQENIRMKLYSNKLIQNIKDKLFDTNFTRFNLDLIQYKIALKIFMYKDRIEKINLYSAEWISLEKALIEIKQSIKYSEDEKCVILSNIENDKKLIEKHMAILKSDFDYSRLKLFIKLSYQTKNKIIENYKNIINIELENKKFDLIKNILNEIKKFILIFNKSSENEINENFDVDFIIQLLINNSIQITDIDAMSEYIISKLKKLASKSTELEIDNEFNIIKEKSSNNINNYISEILIFSMNIVNIIRDEITSYGELIKLQQL